MKRLSLALSTIILSVVSISTAFAGSWKQDANGWTYINDNGSNLKSQWEWLDGNRDGVAECYYFDERGYMAANRDVGGYWVNADGAWVDMYGTVQTKVVNNNMPIAPVAQTENTNNYTSYNTNTGSIYDSMSILELRNVFDSLEMGTQEWFTVKEILENRENIEKQAKAAERVKVACVGDSNTYGKGVSNKEVESYPAQLQSKLGNMYEVKNFGLSNASVETGSALCYTESDKYIEALNYKADKYILMFGTNDAKLINYKGKDKFKSDYKKLINKFGKDKVILMEIAPVNYSKDVMLDEEWTTPEMVLVINNLIREIAAEEGVKLVRNYSELNKIKKAAIVSDGVHMNKIGLGLIAENVRDIILI